EGEGLAEPYPPARCTQSSAVRAPEVDEHDALEGARPCRARIRPAAELDGRQDRAHHRHRASEIQDRHDEPRLQHPPAGSARANGSCTRLSALTGGVRVASCKGPRGRRPGVKTVPDRGLTSERALQPPAQPRQKSLKASIVRGSLNFMTCPSHPTQRILGGTPTHWHSARSDATRDIEILSPLLDKSAAPTQRCLGILSDNPDPGEPNLAAVR